MVSMKCDKHRRRNVGHSRENDPYLGRTSPILLIPIAAQDCESVEKVNVDDSRYKNLLSLVQSNGLYLFGTP